jgi:glycosyltransferase involved in cell wall biosynthesis
VKISLVTDAWFPQVNGVVTTLAELVQGVVGRGHAVDVIEPSTFRRIPCPGYREIDLSLFPAAQVARRLAAADADAIHIATEGPLGRAARRWCLHQGRAFTTAFHTRFPEILARALHLPTAWGYAAFRRFHAPAAGVMVPSEGMREILRAHRFERLLPWTHGVDLSQFQPVPGADLGLPRPVWLYVGRVSYEKNLDAFLGLDLPGSKVVYGVGPLLEPLRRAHPGVHWRGVVPRTALAAIYSAADAFVFPSRCETFGLVMLEALACGLPVAAYPEAGPLDVLGTSGVTATALGEGDHARRAAGVLDHDLRAAALGALRVSRLAARERALAFGWDAVCEQFIGHLRPARPGAIVDGVASPQAAA